MANQKYNLNLDEFDSVVQEYTESLDGFEYQKELIKGQIIYRFNKTSVRFCSVLTCYISQGRVSFQASGKSPDIAGNCMTSLIEKTEVTIGESKTFSIKPATDEEVQTIIDFFQSDYECQIDVVTECRPTIKYSAKICGKYGDFFRLTHYETNTLLVQGRPGFTFLSFIEIATELFNPNEVKREHLKLFNVESDNPVFYFSLESHLPNAYSKIGLKLDAIMAPSLILINDPKAMDDYSSYAFPVLKGSEGVLKKIFVDEGIVFKNFGEFFKYDPEVVEIKWAKDCSSLFPNAKLRKSLLDLYEFYYRERHTLFHMDSTIETSRILNFDEALNVVKKGLTLIDQVYYHLN